MNEIKKQMNFKTNGIKSVLENKTKMFKQKN